MAPATVVPGSAPQVVAEFHCRDVLLGRGAPIVNYKGNVVFREVVSSRKDEYFNTESHQVKDNIAREIVDEIGACNGRFLRRVEIPEEATRLGLPPDEKVWIVADDDVVIEKVKQALRDKIAAQCKTSAVEATNSEGSPGGRKRRRLTPPSTGHESSLRPQLREASASSDGVLVSFQEQTSSSSPEILASQASFLLSNHQLPQQAHAGSPYHDGASHILSLLQQQQAQAERVPPSYLTSFLAPGGQQSTQQNYTHGNVQPTSLPLLALRHLERTSMQDSNQLAALQPLEALRRIEIARAEENANFMALRPFIALQRLEMARAEEESQRIALQQLQLSRAEEESHQAPHSLIAVLQRWERAREGHQLRDITSLESLQCLDLSQLNERTRQTTLAILLERQRELETQQLRQLAGAHPLPLESINVSSLPAASNSVLESFAALAEQHGASKNSASRREATQLPTQTDAANSPSALTPESITDSKLLAVHVSDLPRNNESSPSSTSTNEQDRKPRARTNSDVDPG